MGKHVRLGVASITATSHSSVYLISDAKLFKDFRPSVRHQYRRITSDTVTAPVTTSSICIDAGVEADVGARVRGDDGAGVVAQVDGLGAGFGVVFGGVRFYPYLLEAVLRVGGGPAADDGPIPFVHRLQASFQSLPVGLPETLEDDVI